MLYNRSPAAGPFDKYVCRGGIVFGLKPGGTEFFLYFNNPFYSSSDWGCTAPPGWTCTVDGNEHGQPLKMQVNITKSS